MLYTIAVVLIILWLLGLVTAYTMGWLDTYFVGDRYCDRAFAGDQWT